MKTFFTGFRKNKLDYAVRFGYFLVLFIPKNINENQSILTSEQKPTDNSQEPANARPKPRISAERPAKEITSIRSILYPDPERSSTLKSLVLESNLTEFEGRRFAEGSRWTPSSNKVGISP